LFDTIEKMLIFAVVLLPSVFGNDAAESLKTFILKMHMPILLTNRNKNRNT
jgi:hypothetical protein